MTPIRIGLIGAGVIGRAHAAILAKLPPEQAQFVRIADPSEAGAALAQEASLVSGWDGARTVAATLAVGRSAATQMPMRPEELTRGGE